MPRIDVRNTHTHTHTPTPPPPDCCPGVYGAPVAPHLTTLATFPAFLVVTWSSSDLPVSPTDCCAVVRPSPPPYLSVHVPSLKMPRLFTLRPDSDSVSPAYPLSQTAENFARCARVFLAGPLFRVCTCMYEYDGNRYTGTVLRKMKKSTLVPQDIFVLICVRNSGHMIQYDNGITASIPAELRRPSAIYGSTAVVRSCIEAC